MRLSNHNGLYTVEKLLVMLILCQYGLHTEGKAPGKLPGPMCSGDTVAGISIPTLAFDLVQTETVKKKVANKDVFDAKTH